MQFQFTKSSVSRLGKLILITTVMFVSQASFAQKSGLIFQTAGTGAAVLDPNGDGYISETSAGFLTANDLAESEIKYKPIPQLVFEPNSDLATGPSCGFTDFIDDGGEYAAGVFFDGTNFLFRFRLAGTANNSKGYSILIDTDQKMGAYGNHQDPNYTSGNPGFEIEIVLQTNFGVYLYDVDGVTSPVQKGTALSYANYCQKAVAENIYEDAECDNKYFYDFYIPLSTITTYFPSFSADLPLRFVANTVIAPKSVLQGPISDIQGVDNTDYASSDLAWTAAINNIYPTSLNNLSSTTTTTFGPTNYMDRTTNIPVLTSPINVGATGASGTLTTAATGTIYIYKVGTTNPVCSTSISSSAVFSVSGCAAFAANDQVYATLTETGKSESASSNIVLVQSCTLTVSASLSAPITAQNEKKLTGTCLSGSTVKVYQNGVFYGNAVVTTTTWDLVFAGSGNFLIPCGTWQVTQTEAGKCESALSEPFCQTNTNANSVCVGTFTATATPTILSPVYNNDKVVSGTTVSGATVYLYVNNVLTRTVTATGTTWIVDGLTLNTNDVILVRALAPGANVCRSVSVTATVIQAKLIAPVVSSPLLAGSSSVSGSSVEDNNTTITVYRNRGGSISTLGTATVTDGAWTLSGLGGTVLQTNDLIYAAASAAGKTTSDNSSNVTIQGAKETVVPTITTLLPVAGTTVVSGTLPIGILTSTTYTIVLYIDDVAIDTFTQATGISTLVTTAWSSTTLHNVNTYWDYLYSGGVLSARAYRANTTSISDESNTTTVACSPPSSLLTWSNSSAFLNDPASIDVTVNLSETGVVYTLVDNSGVIMGNSKIGTGGTITLTSIELETTKTLRILAQKMEAGACESYLSGTKTVTVDVEAVYTNNTTSKVGSYANSEVIATVTDADNTITSATVSSGSLPPGTALSSNGTITVTQASNLVADTYNFSITTTATKDGNSGTTVTPLTMTFDGAPLPVELIYFGGTKNGNDIHLRWATAWEKNNDYFELERSFDGNNWNVVHKEKGAGDASYIINYKHTDHLSPYAYKNSEVVYYKLRQVDFNGQFEYSRAISFRLNDAGLNSARIDVVPNPSINGNAIVVLEEIGKGQATIYLHDSYGKMIASQNMVVDGGLNNINVTDLAGKNLVAGVYHLTIQLNGEVFRKTFITK